MKKDRYLKKLLVLNIILALVIGMFPSVVSRAASIPTVSYKTCVKSLGWLSWSKNGTVSGKANSKKNLNALKVKISNSTVKGDVKYRSYVGGQGWDSWVTNGTLSGYKTGVKRIEAVQIKLTGALAKAYDIYYRTCVEDFGWLGWAKNGAVSGNRGLNKRVEAIQIKLVKKGAAAPGTVNKVKSVRDEANITKSAFTKEWKAAYKKTVKDYYKNYTDTKDVFIDDMDKDGIPELFCVSDHTVSYFSYNNKKTNVIAAYEVNGGYLSVRFYSGQHYTMVVGSIFDTVYAFSKDGTLFYTTPEYLSDGGVEYVLKTEDGKVLAKGEEKINKYVKKYGYEFSKKDTPSPYLHAQGKYKEIIGANKGETNGNTIKLAATLNEALAYITNY